MQYVKSFRDLEVYRLSRQLSKDIFEATKKFPKEEMYSLTDQIRRSSRSIGAQIAEAWAKRKYEKHFVSKLTDADGEQLETQHWIETALDASYFSTDEAHILLSQYASIGRMLHSMISKSASFCTQNPRTGDQ
ncbi:four helix bundle protein [Chryseolinea sp. H1M3-3]|uniref:four helix bundle protein n=1 Tax=Chryseolinea sp. H1M3-3 TaxID=3034144 RepID=UPI0023EABEAF|nr:four helix bundle protein [Chryseolinea sp. H1M3-3]